jgi:chromate reductase
MKNILIITASNGHNLKLAKSFEEKYSELDAKSEILDLVELDLPLYSPKAEQEQGVPKKLTSWLEKVESADALVFCAPEYNGGVPPTLTNFIAWTSRADKDWRKFFNAKTAAIASFSGSGGVNVLNSMRVQLSYIGCNVIGRHIMTHMKMPLKPEDLDAVARLSFE